MLSQITAEALGCPVELVKIVDPDTSRVPDSGPTVASRTTVMSGNAIRDAAAKIRAAMEPVLADSALAWREAVRLCVSSRSAWPPTDGRSRPTTTFDLETGQGEAYICYSWSANVVEVEVDTETGETRVTKVWSGHDAGRVINPTTGEGQVEGGVLQGLGYALVEEHTLRDGRILNDQFSTYIIPTTLDTPEIKAILVEHEFPWGPYGAKGLGETPIIAVAPAVTAAIHHATGAHLDRIPATPERVWAALRARSVEGGRARRRRPLRQPQGVPAQGAHRSAPARRAARGPPPHRGQGGMRQGRVRRLHGARGRPGGRLLPDDGLPGRRHGRRDDRGAGRRRPAPAAGGVHRRGRRAVRDLHPGDDPRGQGRPGRAPEADRGRGPPGPGRQPLPLHRLHQDLRRRRPGRDARRADQEPRRFWPPAAAPRYFRPRSLEEALEILAQRPDEVRPLAGGTDILVKAKDGAESRAALFDLTGVPELQGHRGARRYVWIGAATTHAEMMAVGRWSRRLRPRCPRPARSSGGPQIRNRGTLGGNLANASPAADTVPPLFVADAVVEVVSVSARRDIPIDGVLHRPAPEPARARRAHPRRARPQRAGVRGAFLRLGQRQAQAISKVSVAVAIAFRDGRPDWVRVALGSVAPTVVRARETEKALMAGGRTRCSARDAVRAEVRPIDDLRSTAEYRREMAGVLLERAVRRVAEA